MKPELVINRPHNSRKKWICIFCTYINGVTEEVARFTHKGDANLYLMRLENADTIERITVE